MLKTLRTNTKWVMITVAVCFVGMMVFAWGMDLAGRSGGKAGMVGKINGRDISYEYYNSLVQQRRSAMGDNQPMTFDMERRLHEEVWNEIVMQVLVQQEIEKRKISFTDNELVSFMVSNPVQGAAQAPIFQDENGSFSPQKYRDFILNRENLNNPQTSELIRYVEEQAKGTLPVMKLQQQVAGNVVITEPQVRERWLAENEQRRVEFVYYPAARLFPAENPVDPKDVEAYYNAHKNEFKEDEQRSLNFVFFRLAPTAQDSAAVLDKVRTVADRAKTGEDFAELANAYSEDPGNVDPQGKANGGDLGFVRRGMMVKEFEDVAFSLSPGQVSDPFMTRFGYHIVKVDSVKTGPVEGKRGAQEVTEVKARHILLKIEPTVKTREQVETSVRQFIEAASKKGADFNALAKAQNLDVITTPLFKKDDAFIPYLGGSVSMLASRAFNAKKGEVLPQYQVDSGFYALKVAEIKPAGIRSLEDVRGQVENRVRMEAGAKLAAERAGNLLQALQSGTPLAQAAAADSSVTGGVRSELVTKAGNVPGLGVSNPLVGKVFTIDTIGGNTGVVTTETGAGIAVLQEKLTVDEARYQADRDQLRQRLEAELQNELISRFLENLREQAKIVDHRSQIFTM